MISSSVKLITPTVVSITDYVQALHRLNCFTQNKLYVVRRNCETTDYDSKHDLEYVD